MQAWMFWAKCSEFVSCKGMYYRKKKEEEKEEEKKNDKNDNDGAKRDRINIRI